MRFTSIAFFLIAGPILSAQSFSDACDYVPPRQANNWYFVNSAGLTFNHSVNALTDNNVMVIGKASAVMSDSLGDLLMLTDGLKVWNRNFDVMPGGSQLLGDIGCTQSSVIIANPDVPYVYYIFTVDKLYPPGFPIPTHGLNYAVVSFLNESLGEVTSSSNALLPEVTEKITAVYHANGEDVWVLTHGYQFPGVSGDTDGNAFYSFLVTGSGVNKNPVISRAGSSHEGDLTSNNNVGYMKASPDGSKVALAIFGLGRIELFDFDNQTGEAFLSETSDQGQFPSVFGIEFSPDVSKLYAASAPLNNMGSTIYQMDLNDPDPFLSPEIISTTNDSIYGALQLGPDGKIYVARFKSSLVGKDCVGVIENPNRPGPACNFREAGVSLEGRQGNSGLPNFMQGYLDIPHFVYYNHCLGDETSFQIWNYTNIDSQSWDFGDPESGANNSSPDELPLHRFTKPGTYAVSVTEVYNGQNFTNSEQVTILPLPNVDLGSDSLFMYPGASFTLDAGPGWDYYFWNGEPGGQKFVASDTGLYYVMVVDSNCCYNVDSVRIFPSDVYIPNAFTPNNDGYNDQFKPVGLPGGVLNFEMLIYSRWGQLLSTSRDIRTGWDGKINGTPAPLGVYIYKISYDVQLDFGTYDSIVLKGHVTLLR